MAEDRKIDPFLGTNLKNSILFKWHLIQMATYSNGTLFKWQPIQMVPYSNGILFKQYPIQRGNDTWFMFRKKRTGLKGL